MSFVSRKLVTDSQAGRLVRNLKLPTMKQIESNFLAMVGSTLANLKKDQDYWSNDPDIVSEVNAINSDYNRINERLNAISGLDTKGYTESKNISFDAITTASLKLSRKMSVYARKNKDSVLLKLVDHSISSLTDGSEKTAISRCTAIVDKAAKMLDVLLPFKITEVELAHIRQLMDVFQQHLDGRSTVKTDKTVSISDIPEMISALKERLYLLDDMIEGYIDDADMIARYKAARITIDYGKGKTVTKVAESKSTQSL